LRGTGSRPPLSEGANNTADSVGCVARAGSRSFRDCVVWAVIIGGHVLLIAYFTMNKRSAQVSADVASPGTLFFIDLPPRPSTAEPVPDVPQLASASMIDPGLPPPAIDSGSTAITLPPVEEGAPGTSAIDWKREAERSAHAVVENAAKSREKHIGEHPPSPFQEKPKPKEFDWDPEPAIAGFAAGFIPYVRIGQRCVVGLGFLGCALGKKPPANGHLFDGMHDPNRQRSSVPDIDTSSALDPQQQ
jgi:hypothetical protein